MPKYRFDQIAINSTEKKKPVEADKDTYIGLEHLDSGNLEVSRWGSEVAPIGDKLVMRKGDVLFGRRRAYQKKVAIAPFDGIFSAHGMVLRPIESVITKEFFPFFISSDYFLDAAIQISVGSLSPTINWRDLCKLEFNIPSIEQQNAISGMLQEMNHLKNAYGELLKGMDVLVQSQFVEMFDAVEGAEYIPLEKCCLSVSGGNTPSMKHEEYYGGDVPFIKSGDVKDAYVSSGALWLTQEALDKTMAKLVPAGTVIVVIRSGILKHDLPVAIASNPVVINQDLKAFQPKPNFTSQYLAWAIRVKENELLSMTRAMTVDNIESQELYNIPVMVAPIGLQREFSDFVEQCDKSKLAIRQALESLEKSRNTIMKSIFG